MDALGRAQLEICDKVIGDVEEALDRGDIEAARQHFAHARWLLEGLLESRPNDDTARLELATTLEREANAESDFGSLAAALELYAKARVHWHRLAEASPYDLENFWGWLGGNWLAAAFIRGTGFDEAEPFLRRAREVEVDRDGDTFRHDLALANAAWGQGRHDDARGWLLPHRDDYRALLDLAAVELDLDNPAAAAIHLAVARSLLPQGHLAIDPNLRARVELVRLRLDPDPQAARTLGRLVLDSLLETDGADRVVVARYRTWLGLPYALAPERSS